VKQAANDVGVSLGGNLDSGLVVNVDTDSGEVVINLKTITGKLEELIGVIKGTPKMGRNPERVPSIASTNMRNYI
jgi:hypothetical protein